MDRSSLWAWTIKNSVCVICWTVLAVVFNKWWIALFSILFMDRIETKYKTYRICDKCGKHSPYADSDNEALAKAREAGWLHYVEGDKDYCPDCQ